MLLLDDDVFVKGFSEADSNDLKIPCVIFLLTSKKGCDEVSVLDALADIDVPMSSRVCDCNGVRMLDALPDINVPMPSRVCDCFFKSFSESGTFDSDGKVSLFNEFCGPSIQIRRADNMQVSLKFKTSWQRQPKRAPMVSNSFGTIPSIELSK